MKHAIAIALTVFFAAASAHAEAPKYTELPKGTVTAPPSFKKAPAYIGPRERAPGVFLVREREMPGRSSEQRSSIVVGTAKQAELLRSGEGFAPAAGDICFTEADTRHFAFEQDELAEVREWSGGLSSHANIWPKTKDNPSGGVAAVHAERVVEKDGFVSLEIVDAWVDPATLGSRTITTTTLPLQLIGKAMNGLAIYAARGERPDGGKTLEVVAIEPTHKNERFGAQLRAERQDANVFHAMGCNHVHASLTAEPKSGDSLVLTSLIEIRDRDGKGEQPPKPVEVTRRFLPMGKNRLPAPLPDMVEREARTREAQVQVSISQTSRDKEPIVGISMGWSGREQTVRVFEPAAEKASPGS